LRMLFFGLGFISYSAAFLLGRKYEITVTSRTLPPVHPVKKHYYDDLSYMGVRFAKVDPLSEPEKVKNLMRAHDVIVNFIGALSNDEQELMRANYEVPRRWLTSSRRSTPTLFSSTSVRRPSDRKGS